TILEIGKNIFSQILTTTISLTNMVVNFVVSIVICIYTLIDKENFIRYFKKINRIILKDKESITINFIKICNDIIGKYIIAKSLDSLFIGIVATIFLVLIGANYAVLSGVLIGITNMIPFFGPFIGGIPTVLINLFCGPKMAIIVAIFVIILQQIDGNIISPKFVGSRVGINPFLTLFSVTLGGHYFGVLGMILAMPFTGVLKIYLDKLLYLYETKYIIKT
ncbi:MAG: AI-2E family transporter, partial [Romboutsia sp.]|nr:AI-2E family transporter [Romboutsia sp.]